MSKVRFRTLDVDVYRCILESVSEKRCQVSVHYMLRLIELYYFVFMLLINLTRLFICSGDNPSAVLIRWISSGE